MSESNGHVNNQSGLVDWMTVARCRSIVNNAVSSARQEWLQRGHLGDRRRDVYAECGYPGVSQETKWLYRDLHEREAIAGRVNELWPRETWQVSPYVYESEDSDEATEFELAWDELGKMLRPGSAYRDEEGSPVWEYAERLDIVSGIGCYGGLLIGVDDGKELSEPAYEIDPKTGQIKGKPRANARILYLRIFPEYLADITQFETDTKSVRFGQPKMYLVTFNDPREQPQGGIGQGTATKSVHWTRFLHVPSDDLLSCEWAGAPRCRAVLNNLLGLQKVYCSSPEMWWQAALYGLAFNTHPQLGGDVDINIEETKDQVENYFHSLQRFLVGRGGSWQPLSGNVHDPNPQVQVQIEAICVKLGCPVPVFKGYEIGEQASSENQRMWDKRVRRRQQRRANPQIIIPLVDRLQALGVLPQIEQSKVGMTANQWRRLEARGRKVVRGRSGRLLIVNAKTNEVVGQHAPSGFCIEWPDITQASASEKATVFAQRMAAMASYISGGVEALMPPRDMLTREADYDEEEAAAILDNAAKEVEANMAEQETKQQEQIDAGLIPDPTQPQVVDETGNPVPPKPAANPFAPKPTEPAIKPNG